MVNMSMTENSHEGVLKDYLMLDTGTTVSVVGNDKLVTNIKRTKPIILATNAGTKTINRVATIDGIGQVYYGPIALLMFSACDN